MHNEKDVDKLYEDLIGFFIFAALFAIFSTALLWAAEREQELGIWNKSSERMLVEQENK